MIALCVLPKDPLPADDGSRQRLVNVVVGLRAVGRVDVFISEALAPARVAELRDKLRVESVSAASPLDHSLGLLSELRWLVSGRMPSALSFRDYDALRVLCAPQAHTYDVAWYATPDTYAALRDLVAAPAIVDMYDIEELKLRGKLRVAKARTLAGRVRARVDVRRWAGFARRLVAEATQIVVCSDVDAAHLGAANVVVIPNGYERPAKPTGRAGVGDPPTLLFQGKMTYEPNVDAAVYLVRQVLPLILQHRPDVALRIVGRASPEVHKLAVHPSVTVTGHVASIEDELGRADAVVVPMRFGSGTRIKILEAFAHRIPVVSTTLGAQGLGVTSGDELLIADTPDELAEASLSVLRDPDLRSRLTINGERAFLNHYQWETIRDRITELASAVASDRQAGPQ